jgi:hypothetical protein
MSVYILKSENIKQNAVAEIQSLKGDCGLQVSITRPKRSLAQNDYWHKLIDVIADFTGDHPEDLKTRIKYECLPLKEVSVHGNTYLYPASSAGLNKKDFTTLIEKTLFIAHDLGLKIPSPSHYGVEL